MRFGVRTPCAEDWSAMAPSGGGRRCARCDRDVVDLSVLTRERAEERVRAAGGAKLCVRIAVDARGEPVFRREIDRTKRRLALVALAGALLGCEPPPLDELDGEPSAAIDGSAPPPPELGAAMSAPGLPSSPGAIAADPMLDLGPPMLPVGLAPEPPAPAPTTGEEPAIDDPSTGPSPDQRARTRRKHRQQAIPQTPPQLHHIMGDWAF